jgi:hypothetical protein
MRASLQNAGRLRAFRDTSEGIVELQKKYQEVRTDPQLTGEQKQEQILGIQRRAIQLAEQTLRAYPPPQLQGSAIRRMLHLPSLGAPQVGAEAR